MRKNAEQANMIDAPATISSDDRDGVTVAICTYRRASIFSAILSIINQRGAESILKRIVVVDNDESDKLHHEIRKFCRNFIITVDYVHAPKKNISIARNAAVHAAETRYLAFIDDDEQAECSWLAELWGRRQGAHVVVGPSRAIYGNSLSPWLARCDFHSNPLHRDQANAHTSNVLLDLDFVRKTKISFLEELGVTGGEDTVFFHALANSGAQFASAPNAVVIEEVPLNRANMKWVLRRMYRAGQTHGLVCKMFNYNAYQRLFLTAGAKALVSSLMAVMSGPGTDSSRRWLARGAMHFGAVHYRLRPKIIKEYA